MHFDPADIRPSCRDATTRSDSVVVQARSLSMESVAQAPKQHLTWQVIARVTRLPHNPFRQLLPPMTNGAATSKGVCHAP
jgi:hypothetical protein